MMGTTLWWMVSLLLAFGSSSCATSSAIVIAPEAMQDLLPNAVEQLAAAIAGSRDDVCTARSSVEARDTLFQPVASATA
jgi:hypothetical protein